MARTFSIFAGALPPHISTNSCGPYYANDKAYWFFQTGQNIRGRSTSDLASFDVVGGGPTYTVNEFYCAGFAEYQNGTTHYLYTLIGTNPPFTVDPKTFDLWRFDFADESWSEISAGNAFDPGPFTTAADIYDYGLPTPFASCNFSTPGFFLIVDPSTGIPYVISYTITPGATDTLNIGYQSFNGSTWSAFTSVLSSAAGGLVGPAQAWVTSGVVYILVSRVGVTAGALNKAVDYLLVRGDGAVMTSTVGTYHFNNPGCPPFFEPTWIRLQGLIPPTFAFTFPTGFVSKPVTFGGAVYLASANETRNLRLYKFSGTTLQSFDTADTVMIDNGISCSGGGDYGLVAQVFVINGTLQLIWKRQTDHLKNFASPLNNTCAALGAANYPALFPRNDWYVASVSPSGTIGTPTAFDVSVSEQGTAGIGGPYKGTMPAYLPNVGLTFAVFQSTSLTILGPPLPIPNLTNPGDAGRRSPAPSPNQFDWCLHREFRVFQSIDYERLGCGKLPNCFRVDEREWGGWE